MSTNNNLLTSVTVIIPIYNSGISAIKSIYSVLSQTRPCDEVIIVDDGSTDNSAIVVSKEFAMYNNISIYTIANRGAAGARNYGISKARSYFVAFLDSDDTWFPDKLKIQINELERDTSVQLIGSLTNMQGFKIKQIPSLERITAISLHNLLFKNYFQTSTVVIRRAVLDELGGFPEGRRFAEEGDLFMRIAARYKCVLLNEIMVDYAGGKRGFGTAGLSANLWRMELGELSNIRRVRARGDSGLLLTGAALTFSLIKFFRRVAIRLSWRFFRSA